LSVCKVDRFWKYTSRICGNFRWDVELANRTNQFWKGAMSIAHLLAQTSPPPDDQHGMLMSIIIWLFIGLLAGFLGSKIVNKSGDGVVLDIILGLVGSFVGGFLFSLIGVHAGGVIGSIIVATIGAIIVLVIYHKLIRGRSA
jgi:uncharacterized membrane protein YeaQ/YmgE (transglycosylase-associated protein family)